jgi:hypothetical protein
VIRPLPDAASRVLKDGVFCYLASRHSSGPHVTPVVFAVRGSRIWVTTSRGSVKARTWRRDPRVGGLVRAGDRAVVFAGRVVTFDLLEPGSWPRSVLQAPSLTRAATAFTAKNARFFAGYAVDAYRVPLAWTPPGRVFAAVELDRIAMIRGNDVARTWGGFGSRIASATTFRARRAARDPLEGVPAKVRDRIGVAGEGVLGVEAPRRPAAALPCRFIVDGGDLYAVLPSAVLALASPHPDAPISLTVDHASRWRARSMAGVLVQGDGRVHEIGRLRSGARSAARIAETSAVVRVRPHRIVWWAGWDSGTVRPAAGGREETSA